MKPISFFSSLTWILLLCSCQVTREMPPAMAVYGPQSDFIFKGQVRILHTSTIDAHDAESLGIVRVNDIIKSPESLQSFRGKDVTVRFNDINSMTVGKELVLFTNVMHVGNEIGVIEVANMYHDPTAESIESLRNHSTNATKMQQDEDLKVRVREAEIIVSGVISRTALIPSRRTVESEHDPMWTEANIRVTETLKGKTDSGMSFVFAASNDVMWYNAPKFKEGDQGVFLFKRRDDTGQLENRFTLTEKTSFYTDKETIDKIKKYVK